MTVRKFLDTNVLVYANDTRDPRKQAQAASLIDETLREGTLVVSTQVLQEYFVAATRKLAVPAHVARAQVALLSLVDVVVPGVEDILAAMDLHQLRGYSYWDSLIIRTALAGRCAILFSEDLQHGHRIDGLQIVNPFV